MKKDKQFKVGCSGFYNWHWKGLFYPEQIPQSKWFQYYCSRFDTVELNSTFYKFPTPESLHKWFKKSPDDFVFSVKAPKIITHMKKFQDCQRYVGDFYHACEKGLEHKMACALFQLPPSLHYDEEKLGLILSLLRPEPKNVLEFRHPSWWTKKVYDELSHRNITFCTVDHPALPANLITNTATVYVRIHGNPHIFHSNYSPSSQNELYESIARKRKIENAFIYFNNTAGAAGVIHAQDMRLQCGLRNIPTEEEFPAA